MFPVLKYPASSQSAKPKKNTTAVEIRILWAVSSDMAHLVHALFTPIQNLMPPRQSSLLAAVFLGSGFIFSQAAKRRKEPPSPPARDLSGDIVLLYDPTRPEKQPFKAVLWGPREEKDEAKGYKDGCRTQGDRAL